MLLTGPTVALDQLEREAGWVAKPEGLCKGDRCVPVPGGTPGTSVDAALLAERLRMGYVVDDARGVAALGPESDGPVLTSADAPDFELPDMVSGAPFRLSSLRGKKVVLYAWSSW